ncbi:hypothetical protein [Methylobrevis pamukkalensis]|uniref:Uncharacterized protein n=1 Tax=Methylobrevis pamukkalensis TaxID=1439726 RepID=A0A1E3H539_9HYPH|nr:hypothetical protein [Methylobrevis pamukkalensis]ODN71422.1 hypothetical protein A6302_01287 [Methylobrevis pamukkalensis]
MGLDLVVEGCARDGHEAEWRRMVDRAFRGDRLNEAEIERFAEISIPPYERLGAPRVGHDTAADDWIVAEKNARTPEEVAAVLREFHGYHVLDLLTSDGLPTYSNAALNDELNETSFRGEFLRLCGDVLAKDLIDGAWDHKLPDAAIGYGKALLEAADAAAAGHGPVRQPPKRGLLARLGLARPAREPLPLDKQLAIVRAAGRWYVFWGERGHPIRAWS